MCLKMVQFEGVHRPLVVVLEEGRSLLPTGHPCCVLNSLTADLVGLIQLHQ